MSTTTSGSITVNVGDIISATLTTGSGVYSEINYLINGTVVASVDNSSGSVSLPAQSPLSAGNVYKIDAAIS